MEQADRHRAEHLRRARRVTPVFKEYLMSRRFLVLVLIVLSVIGAACAPIVTPVAVEPTPATPASGTTAPAEPTIVPPVTPTATAEAVTPQATVAGAGATLAGTIRYAGKPLGGARIELRPLGWATTGAAPVASAVADANGMFTLPNPPVGDWSVVGFFPDGEVDAGGWPPVSIAEGQAVLGFVVPLERKLILLAPIAGQAASETPTLSWQPATDAVSYRVWVIDAGTTEMALDQATSATSVVVPSALAPTTYQWVVNALDAAGELVATGSETFQVGGAASATPALPGPADVNGLPPSCQPRAGEFAAFGDATSGFCFRYPEAFQAIIPEGIVNAVGMVVGPALDASADPLRAALVIEAVPSEGLDLKTVVGELLREFEGQPGIAIRQRPFDLGGVPAVLLEGVPGRGGSRDIVAVQNGIRYRLLFMPDPAGFPQVKADLERLFDAVTQSFTFLIIPAEAGSAGQTTQPGTMPRLPDDERAFAGARAALATRLGVDELAIRRVEVTSQEWPDACLGVARSGQMCAQVITPGWVVVMETGGRQYRAHTDQGGIRVRLLD
jgi:hypothetical protein